MTRRRRKKQRVRRIPGKRVLIVCEGETEKIYFQGLKESDDFRQKGSIELRIVPSRRSDPLNILKEASRRLQGAQQEGNPYDGAWAVFDKNSYDRHDEAFRFANSNDIKIAFSSISFEVWFLLHYEQTTRPFTNSDSVVRHIRDHHNSDYKKTGQNHWVVLENFRDTAVENARWLRNQKWDDLIEHNGNIYELNPFITVDELVCYLLGIEVL